jgi:hypothetical protein
MAGKIATNRKKAPKLQIERNAKSTNKYRRFALVMTTRVQIKGHHAVTEPRPTLLSRDQRERSILARECVPLSVQPGFD